MANQFAVIGLGTFGRTIALELARLGHQVLGIDRQQRLVDPIADSLTHAAIADATNEQALEELNIAHYDTVVVAIGEHLEASLLCTLHLKTLGVKNIWVKAITSEHHRIVAKLGATRIMHPEHEMGIRVAQSLNYPMVNDYLPLGGDHFLVTASVGDRLKEQQLRDLFDGTDSEAHVMLIKRHGSVIEHPEPTFKLELGDVMVLNGTLTQLRRLADRLA